MQGMELKPVQLQEDGHKRKDCENNERGPNGPFFYCTENTLIQRSVDANIKLL